MFEAEVEALEDDLQVLHHRLGLRHDALRQHARRGRAVGHLAGDEDKTVGLDGVAEGRYGLRPIRDHVELHRALPLLDDQFASRNRLFFRIACTPQLPSTTWVTPKSTAADIRAIASSSLNPFTSIRKRRILRKASFMARSSEELA